MLSSKLKQNIWGVCKKVDIRRFAIGVLIGVMLLGVVGKVGAFDEVLVNGGALWGPNASAQIEANALKITSPSVVVIDTLNGRILYGKNAFKKRQIASTTKMMTAILAIEKSDLNDIVTVSKKAASVGGSQAHLKVGEEIKMEHLLYALLLPSGNDAGVAIAEHIGGSVDEFVEMMDEKAQEMGVYDTKFGSPHGLDRINHSTAYDLALIARYALQNTVFARIVSTKSKVIPRQGWSQGSEYKNTNKLLFTYEGADGIKTGYTGPAGRCLVSSATRDDWQVIGVVLGANSTYYRFDDSKKLLNYAFEHFSWITVLEDGQMMARIPVEKGQLDTVMVRNKGQIGMYLHDSELTRIERVFVLPNKLTAPVIGNQEIGEVIFKLDDVEIGRCKLYTAHAVSFWTIKMNWNKMINHWFRVKEHLQKHLSM